ncbi:MAG TPA: hypothetical protein VFF69_12490 [Phycisphaerales bacterium]|nr:hypothetical protein [Phycisphaerales bacterium]
MAFALLLVVLVVGALNIGGAAQQPFQARIANSDLVPEGYRGRLGAFVDLSRWTPQVREQMFASSGGWFGAWRLTILGTLLLGGAGSAALGAGLVAILRIRSVWVFSIPVAPALATSLWVLNTVQWARAGSPSIGNYASVLAGERVGTPVAFAAATWIATSVTAGGFLVLAVRERRRTSISRDPC